MDAVVIVGCPARIHAKLESTNRKMRWKQGIQPNRRGGGARFVCLPRVLCWWLNQDRLTTNQLAWCWCGLVVLWFKSYGRTVVRWGSVEDHWFSNSVVVERASIDVGHDGSSSMSFFYLPLMISVFFGTLFKLLFSFLLLFFFALMDVRNLHRRTGSCARGRDADRLDARAWTPTWFSAAECDVVKAASSETASSTSRRRG